MFGALTANHSSVYRTWIARYLTNIFDGWKGYNLCVVNLASSHFEIPSGMIWLFSLNNAWLGYKQSGTTVIEYNLSEQLNVVENLLKMLRFHRDATTVSPFHCFWNSLALHLLRHALHLYYTRRTLLKMHIAFGWGLFLCKNFQLGTVWIFYSFGWAVVLCG